MGNNAWLTIAGGFVLYAFDITSYAKGTSIMVVVDPDGGNILYSLALQQGENLRSIYVK